MPDTIAPDLSVTMPVTSAVVWEIAARLAHIRIPASTANISLFLCIIVTILSNRGVHWLEFTVRHILSRILDPQGTSNKSTAQTFNLIP